MDLVITVQESDSVTAEQYLTDAATGWGWDAAQGITAEEFLLDRFDEQLHARYLQARRQVADAAALADIPKPESRGMKVAREREAERLRIAKQAEKSQQGSPAKP